MGMIHNYEKFCLLYNQEKVKPDVGSPDGYNSVQHLIKQGWQIDSRNFFGSPQDSKIAKNLLAMCRKSAENFELAYKHAGIDFWILED